MQSDLKKIKNKYGESMAHLCRDLFPTLLETEGLLYSLLESNFYPSKFLYFDIVDNALTLEFEYFINSLVKVKDNIEVEIDKKPTELLDSVGYILHECKTEDDIQYFKKYYKPGEELCTFRGGRLKTNYVFFAIKKNVDDIKRENFINPTRQDEYGTSVISIQFTKNDHSTVSIKNRYNHMVDNPDSTFSNNLDNIVCGLTRSFEKAYNLNIKKSKQQDFEIRGYVRASDGRFYKYNYEINNIYYCPNNIIIDNFEVKKYENDRYIVLDYFILDMKLKKIELYDKEEKDSFLTGLHKINKVQIKKEIHRKYICLDIDGQPIIIGLDEENRIISYKNNIITQLSNNFLYYNEVIKTLYLENLRKVGKNFLFSNGDLELIDMPSLEEVGDDFLYSNLSLNEISMPCLKKVGNNFITSNRCLTRMYFPILEEVGKNFFHDNFGLTHIEFPSLIKIDDCFIRNNFSICEVYMPCLEEVGSEFLCYNGKLKVLILPRLREYGYQFMRHNRILETLELPELESIGKFYLEYNEILANVVVPENIWNRFIYNGSFAHNFKSRQKKLTTR